MTESQASTSQLIEQIDVQYAAEKAKFEQWKIGSLQAARTEESKAAYNQYVDNFLKWEADVLERRAQLISSQGGAHANPAADVDHQLQQILNNISPMDFVIAMFTTANKDPKFAEAVFTAVPQHPAQQVTPVHHTYGSPAAIYPQVTAATYPTPYQAPAVTSYGTPPVAYNQTPPNFGSTPYTTQYASPTVHPPAIVSTPSVAQEAWANAAMKSYRPPSPVRDYRKIPQLPFSDFSQT
uniref:DUF148 domain-containing protein n=1 Tax=Steinernema glaseri TaxID=37863 RepID=A0A1I8ABH7_9BILA